MRFIKMQGTGNDYVYVDCIRQPMPRRPGGPAQEHQRPALRRWWRWADPHLSFERADARMRMFNADGSESEMCGNGVRCVAKFVYDHGLAESRR